MAYLCVIITVLFISALVTIFQLMKRLDKVKNEEGEHIAH